MGPSYGKPAKRDQRLLSLYDRAGEDEFFPLDSEVDYSMIEFKFNESLEDGTLGKELEEADNGKAGQKKGRDLLLPSSKPVVLKERQKVDQPMKESTHSTGSLDELWTQFLERQKKQLLHNPSRNIELSLVERLDRLARVLQHPIRHSLMHPKVDQGGIRERSRRREQKKFRSKERKEYESTVANGKEVPDIGYNKRRLTESRQYTVEERVTNKLKRILEQEQNSLTPSDTSSDTRPAKDGSEMTDTTTSESDMGTQTELETATQTEGSGSISTIDTARLVRAFGPERVRITPRLSDLYCTIGQQKNRSEKRGKGSGKAVDVDYEKILYTEGYGKRKNAQVRDQLARGAI
uniref:Uncharacterized protein n=1 Tax=Sphenodon punctatus TaxID=8508 RepID=A0A8D0H3A7_SPHPU